MGVREFFSPDAQKRVAEAVRHAESKTSAEVVVAVHAKSGDYRHADLLCGILAAFAGLLVFLYHPAEFASDWYALEFVALLALGTVVSWRLPAMRRLLTSKAWRAAQVRRNALATFHDLGVDKTSGRTGILVLLSTLERSAFVLCDRGIDTSKLGPDWTQAVARIERAAAGTKFGDGDLAELCAAVASLGDALAPTYPRSDDDVNELSDEARVA